MSPAKKSKYQTLADERIKEIVRGARNHVIRDKIPWLYRGEVMGMLALALEHKQDQITIDGRNYDITYKAGERAIVHPTDGTFVPCAHIEIAKYLKEWEAYAQSIKVTRLSEQ
jgi:hypothetical protein